MLGLNHLTCGRVQEITELQHSDANLSHLFAFILVRATYLVKLCFKKFKLS